MTFQNSQSWNKSSHGTVLSYGMTDSDGASRKRNHSSPTSVPRKEDVLVQPQPPKPDPPQQQPDHSKRRKVNTSVSSASSTISDDPEFVELDPSNPVHARRMQQRRRMVSYGKNTVGYDKYVQQVPKDQRRVRSMKTPSTPDHTLDIPNKRWSGMIRAWYVQQCVAIRSGYLDGET
jgi:histone RNA hairpin-binding protein